MQTIYLDISNKGVIPTIYAKQRDVGRKFLAVITDNGIPFDVSEDSLISVWYSGASGEGNYTHIGEKTAFSFEKNKLTVELIHQMLVNHGNGVLSLQIADSLERQIGLWNIPYCVEELPGANSEEAKKYYDDLATAAERAENAAERAENAAENVEDVKPKDVYVTATFGDSDEHGSSYGSASMGSYEIYEHKESGATVYLRDEHGYRYELDAENSQSGMERSFFNAITVNGNKVENREIVVKAGGNATRSIYEFSIDLTSVPAVLYEEQELTEAQQAQARANIGVSTYYNTEREELGIDGENVNAAYIFGLYDALMAEHPDNVQKNEVHNDDGTFTNYEYVISTGEYNTSGLFGEVYGSDHHIKKPKYLVLSAIHGRERKTAFSTYRFIRDVVSGHNVPKAFADGAIIHVMPVGNPLGFDAFSRGNDNDVDINRNFMSNAPEKETQAIKNWLNANIDAELFIDVHNSGTVNEIVAIFGAHDNDVADTTKKVALRGIDRIIPHWRDVIGYPLTLKAPYLDENGKTAKDENGNTLTKDMPVIFSYSVSTTESLAGTVLCYASNVLGIPSLSVELSTYYGDYAEWEANPHEYPPETIAMGAEAIGNILLEFYEQAFFGEVSNDMKEIDNKLDVLAESMASVGKGFRTESGVIVLDADMLPEEGKTGVTIRIPCSNGAKTVDFHADSDTLATIRTSQGTRFFGSLVGNFFAPNAGQTGRSDNSSSYMVALKYDETLPQTEKYNFGWLLQPVASTATNTDGVTFGTYALKAGRYEWIAYYWNE